MGFETFIAHRYLRSPRTDRSISVITKISILGVAIGVTALIVTLSLMNGFEKNVSEALQGVGGHLTISTMKTTGIAWEKDSPLLNTIKETINVEAIAPFTANQAMLMGPNKPAGTYIKGISPMKELEVSNLTNLIRTELFEVKQKRALTPQEKEEKRKKTIEILSKLPAHYEMIPNQDGKMVRKKVSGILIGSQLARNLGIDINDWVMVISPEERVTPMGNMPRAKRFKVVGFFESGLSTYDEVFSLIDLKESQKVFRMRSNITGLSIRLKDQNKADLEKEKLSEPLSFPYYITSWLDQNKNFFMIIQLEKLGLAIILTLIIVIAAFNIISSLVMLVIEKTKDIAILKSMGVSDNSIQKLFMIQGAVIGLTGTVLGEILGLGLCWIIARYDVIDIPPGVYVGNRIPMHVEVWQVALIAVVSLLICFVVTIFPAHKAARLNPVKGLHDE